MRCNFLSVTNDLCGDWQGLGPQSGAEVRDWDCSPELKSGTEGDSDCSPLPASGTGTQSQAEMRDCSPQSGTVCGLDRGASMSSISC